MYTSGLYIIENNVTGDYYGGSSKSLNRRKIHHWHQLKKGIHTNPRLQRSWNKYGREAFTFTPLLIVNTDSLEYFEQRWLDKHYGKGKCMNALPRAGCPSRGKPISQAHREKIRQARLGIPHSPERIAAIREARKHQKNVSWIHKGTKEAEKHSKLMKKVMSGLTIEQRKKMINTRWTPEKRENQRCRMVIMNTRGIPSKRVP